MKGEMGVGMAISSWVRLGSFSATREFVLIEVAMDDDVGGEAVEQVIVGGGDDGGQVSVGRDGLAERSGDNAGGKAVEGRSELVASEYAMAGWFRTR